MTGVGYLHGADVRVEFRPADASTGIVFVRCDLDRPVRIAATVGHRTETPRRTTLAVDGVRAEMVEHALAALAGLQIDNCEVWLDGAELPGLDGSAQPFVAALDRAGSVELPALRRCLAVRKVMRVENGTSWIEARPALVPGLTIRYELAYPQHPVIGTQTLQQRVTPAAFRRELAASRTFLLREEADWLRAQGWAAHVSPADLLVFDADGPVQNRLRFDDECVRHKTLDVIGDLALAGCDVHARIVCHRSGHQLNAALVDRLLREGQIVHEWRRSA